MLVEGTRKNTKTNEEGLTIIIKDDPDYYDSIWDEDISVEESNELEKKK